MVDGTYQTTLAIWCKMSTTRKRKLLRRYERAMMRSAFVSLIWAVIVDRRKRSEGFQMKRLAEATTGDKAAVSRWFSNPERPNWTLNTFADIASALDLEIEVTARERSTGRIFVPHGSVASDGHPQTATEDTPPSVQSRSNTGSAEPSDGVVMPEAA